MIYTLPPLPYAPEALEPRMSRETIEYHYGKHLQTYVDNLNRLTEGTSYSDVPLETLILTATGPIFNNAAQDQTGKLHIIQESNAGNPLRAGYKPLLTIDVWEHAYYIDYRNRRAAFVDSCWDLIDWKKVTGRLHEPSPAAQVADLSEEAIEEDEDAGHA